MNQKTAINLKSWWQNLPPAWRFSVISVTLLRVFYTLWSLFFLSSFSPVVQNQDFFGEPVVTIFNLQTSEAFTYNRGVGGELLMFKAYNRTSMADIQTGSLWQIKDGTSVSGSFQGKSLVPAEIAAERVFPYYGVSAHPIPLLSIWQRFDANWYVAIAKNGYGSVPGDVHFPPLYPVLIRLLSHIFRDNLQAALFISQVSLYIMVGLLYELFAEWGGRELAQKSLFFLLIFPTSFFFFGAYTEATFVIFSLLCLKAIRSRAWHWAGFWIFCAILIRLQGVVLLLPLAWGILQTRFKTVRIGDVALAAFSPLVATGLYLLIRARSGDSAVIPLTETNLHARLVPPWENIRYAVEYILGGAGGYIDVLNLAAFLLFLSLIVVYWKKFPPEFNLFALASLVVFSMRLVDTQPLNSMIRYVLTIFPLFFLFGMLAQQRWINLLMFACFLSLNLFLSAQFLLWGWVA